MIGAVLSLIAMAVCIVVSTAGMLLSGYLKYTSYANALILNGVWFLFYKFGGDTFPTWYPHIMDTDGKNFFVMCGILIITPFVNQKEMINNALKEAGLSNVTCGTVHSFQGDEKDVVLFSTAIGANTQAGTYEWLKANRELINVATSRAKSKLIVLADSGNVERLHSQSKTDDDLYELLQYVKGEGKTVVTPKETNSRALGVKPFSTETETAFLQNLTHALENIWLTQSKYVIHAR